MSKIDTETLKFIVARNEPDQKIQAAIMEEIRLELLAEEEEKALRPPPIKKQNVIILADRDGNIVEDVVGWIVQIPEDDDIQTTLGRIHSAAYEFNTTPKGIRMPVESIGEALECIQAKFFKEQDIWVKSKTPLLAITTDNIIPMDKSE